MSISVTFWFVNHLNESGGFAIEVYANKNEMKEDMKKFLYSQNPTRTPFTYTSDQVQQRKLISKEFNIPLDSLYWGIVGIEKESIHP
jgi:hypothetical protein